MTSQNPLRKVGTPISILMGVVLLAPTTRAAIPDPLFLAQAIQTRLAAGASTLYCQVELPHVYALQQDDRDERVPSFPARLAITAEAPPRMEGQEDLFDAAIEASLKRFQLMRQLGPVGRPGHRTPGVSFNLPFESRLKVMADPPAGPETCQTAPHSVRYWSFSSKPAQHPGAYRHETVS